MRYLVSFSVFLLAVGALRFAGCTSDPTGEMIDHGWGDPERIADGYDPDLAVNASGAAVAVWLYYGGADSEVWAASFAPEDGWGTPERIAAYEDFARYPRVALDPSGNAVAVWQHDRGDPDRGFRRRLHAGGGLASTREARPRFPGSASRRPWRWTQAATRWRCGYVRRATGTRSRRRVVRATGDWSEVTRIP